MRLDEITKTDTKQIKVHIGNQKYLLLGIRNGFFIDDYSDIEIFGEFDISNIGLKSLEGCPKKINGKFNCHSNNLTSLINGPEFVDGDYVVFMNNLKTVEGCPNELNGNFHLNSNRLSSFEHFPSIIKGNLFFVNNPITTLHDIHKHIKFMGNDTRMSFNACDIKSNVLGLLKIKGLTQVYLQNKNVENILNKYLSAEKDLLACQQELIEAGFEEYAQL